MLLKNILTKTPILSDIFRYYHFHSQVRKELQGCESVLDVGCGPNSTLRVVSKDFYSVGIDAFESCIIESKKLGIHNENYVMDVMDIDTKFAENSFDCVVALDVIEHLEKKDGEELIAKMEKIAKKKVLIFTPTGFLPQGIHYGNPYQVHKSGWTPKEMKGRGYRVIGFGGLKLLRKEAELRFKPLFFWFTVSHLSQVIVRNFPQLSFSILCVKNMEK